MDIIYFTYSVMMFPVVFVYLVSLISLVIHLRRRYPAIWMKLGAPRFSSDWASNDPLVFALAFLKLLQFAFSNQNVMIGDRRLYVLIWLVRGSLTLGVALFIAVIATGLTRIR